MTENAPIKLIIVDDHPIVREGMKSLVAGTQDMTIVAETASGIEAIRFARQMPFSVMLLDITLNDKNGIEVLKQIKTEKPDANILIFSMHREDQYAIRALKAAHPSLCVITDVALDPYTSHGHDGLLVGDEIVNDATAQRSFCVANFPPTKTVSVRANSRKRFCKSALM